ncbi:hypothetical protein AMATHDRAFT_62646 [Amanita thiersii Skay4041]|uniref:ribonuclease H n=1 Tax=Amanita thiersii Skay4041 TaxID=703135 RepID=A0A2A9NN36_9AGAR|nr:hypothetical protein AMATHDRAFT_62646 [Amanita thiersii Skay4041]
MPTKPGFYAVRKGHRTGVFLTWSECEAQIKNFPGAQFKKFANAADAEAFAMGNAGTPGASISSTIVVPSLPPPANAVGNIPNARKRPSSVELDESGYDVVYCDGACRRNGRNGSFAGIGVWWGPDDPRNISERCPGEQTNNRAELIAIARVLEVAPKTKTPLLIKTDSQYSINCFKVWLHKWKSNNFKTAHGYPVKNLKVILYISAMLDARALYGQKLRLEYVKGHSGNEGNEGADALASHGAHLPPVPDRDWDALRDGLNFETGMNQNAGAFSIKLPGSSAGPSRKLRRVDPPVDTGMLEQETSVTANHLKTYPRYEDAIPLRLREEIATCGPSQPQPMMVHHYGDHHDPRRLNIENKQMKPPVPQPVSVPVDPRTIDYRQYADCIADEKDLWKDIEGEDPIPSLNPHSQLHRS